MEEVSNWFEQAKADIKTAKVCLRKRRYYASVTFSQQSAEKGLKAIFVKLKQHLPPKIHDLVELCRRVEAPEEVVSQAEKLTATYFSSRYPEAGLVIPAKYYDRKKAKAHLKEAEVIIKWVKKKIR